MTFPITLTPLALAAHLSPRYPNSYIEERFAISTDEETTLPEAIGCLLDEADADVIEYFSSIGFTHDADTGFTIAFPETLAAMDVFCTAYTNHFEAEPTPTCKIVLERSNVYLRDYSGDHVDYNSSFPIVLVEIILDYLEKTA